MNRKSFYFFSLLMGSLPCDGSSFVPAKNIPLSPKKPLYSTHKALRRRGAISPSREGERVSMIPSKKPDHRVIEPSSMEKTAKIYEGTWKGKAISCFLFFRGYEYFKAYPLPGYHGNPCQGMRYCLKDLFYLTFCCRFPSVRRTDPIHQMAREAGHPVCSQLLISVLIMMGYSLFNLLYPNEIRVKNIFKGNTGLCANPIINDMVVEFPNLDDFYFNQSVANASASDSVRAFYDQGGKLFFFVLNNYRIDGSKIPYVASLSAIESMDQYLDNLTQILNDIEAYGYQVYPGYWPNKAQEEILLTQNSSSSTSRFTNRSVSVNETESFTLSEDGVTYVSREFCYSVVGMDFILRTALFLDGYSKNKKICLTTSVPINLASYNFETNIDRFTTVNNVENNYYSREINNLYNSFGTPLDVGELNRTKDFFDKVSTDSIERGKQRLKEALLYLYNNANILFDVYPFFITLLPFVHPGYEAVGLNCCLSCRNSLSRISRIDFILLVVLLSFLVPLMQFGFLEFLLLIPTPHLLLPKLLQITTRTCTYQAPGELALTLFIEERIKKKINQKTKIERMKGFIENRMEIEASYKNVSQLVFRDIYQNISGELSAFALLLNGSTILPGYPLLPRKTLCNDSALFAFNASNGTGFNFPANCLTLFDTDFEAPLREHVRSQYRFDLGGIAWSVFLHPFIPLLVIDFLRSWIQCICPLALERGRVIGGRELSLPREQMRVKSFVRYRSLPWVVLYTPLVILAFVNKLIP